jgi:enoyl-CoA hydratase/carnithine racemase
VNELMHDAIERLSRLPLITMAIVTGGAIGGGSELVTGFDFICMSKQSGFIHFVQTRMGVSSPWGGLRRLVALVGRKKALQWMAGGARLSAQQCFDAGLASVLVDKDVDCLNATLDFLNPFLFDSKTQKKVSSNAVRGMKKLLIRQDKANDQAFEAKIFASTVFSKL